MIFLFPWEDRDTLRETRNQEKAKSESEVKENVRRRDGYRCRDCGITQERHEAEFDRGLQVHRLIPGVIYDENSTVTLCQKCHGGKPKKREAALWCKDLRWIAFNLYDNQDAALYRAMKAQADANGTTVGDEMRSLLSDKMNAVMRYDWADATLTADGL